ncbi:MAG: UDP-N-acetylglucosamine 2-epimerase, partial [bacterium]
LSTMKYVDAVIGNSSSGIIEAPALGVATINIGDRQKGRIKPESVVDCLPNKEYILKAIDTVLSAEFKQRLRNIKNPYGDGTTSLKIVDILKKSLPINNLKKEFYDIKDFQNDRF